MAIDPEQNIKSVTCDREEEKTARRQNASRVVQGGVRHSTIVDNAGRLLIRKLGRAEEAVETIGCPIVNQTLTALKKKSAAGPKRGRRRAKVGQ